jgi:hypothetical protein
VRKEILFEKKLTRVLYPNCCILWCVRYATVACVSILLYINGCVAMLRFMLPCNGRLSFVMLLSNGRAYKNRSVRPCDVQPADSMAFPTNASGTLQEDSLTEARPRPKIPSEFMTNKPPTITGKFFEKVIQKLIQSHLEVNNLLNTNQAGFRARHSTTLQCRKLTDHVTLNFNMSKAAVFLDTESLRHNMAPWLT